MEVLIPGLAQVAGLSPARADARIRAVEEKQGSTAMRPCPREGLRREGADIVTDDRNALDPQGVEQRREIGGENIRRRVLDRPSVAPARIAETAQIRGDDVEALRQRRNVLLPHPAEFRLAMQEHERRPRARAEIIDGEIGRLDPLIGQGHGRDGLR